MTPLSKNRLLDCLPVVARITMAKVKTEEGSLKISVKLGKVDLKIKLPYRGLYFVSYLVLLSLPFFWEIFS
ncbi:hypothetical protein HKBW3S42_01339 [Candidatus Hakubella thermalkaliphila]|uniref:Uncharacterized protein n=1 Tax=Candidatus Hakubella thermalkaliphila TaxID=2754717 RepID=A0A6V8PL88_9ACTN|nr:hypothetical protein [Candidatus Hakubella thermalkaliphila]GFP21028.1 hypothetical protein HKBW3S06_00254 [Candidatus Hakubella thermalkaliphila]GFP33028.1 hypothetical protein HKBW3S42_01339 [Candidatus Hakubella thermalkaliphila]GFP36147.1 hypothetical protein HKBW3S43_01934 [Candidatus Hakubella thermalkaliphila]